MTGSDLVNLFLSLTGLAVTDAPQPLWRRSENTENIF